MSWHYLSLTHKEQSPLHYANAMFTSAVGPRALHFLKSVK
jgi:hypothetical protein